MKISPISRPMPAVAAIGGGLFCVAATLALAGCPSSSASTAGQNGVAPAKPVKLPALAPRPHWVMGRVTFADGRPIPKFLVEVHWPAGIFRSPGANGQYAFQSDPSAFFLSSVTATAAIAFDGQTYVLPLCPVDGVPNDSYHADASKGVVRDFVLKLSGLRPHSSQVDMDPLNAKRQDIFMAGAFYGIKFQIGSDVVFTKGAGLVTSSGQNTGVFPPSSTYDVTVTPNGPLADGSTGQMIHRTIKDVTPMFGTFSIYDIPLGKYTVTVRSTGPDGVAHPLKLRALVNSGVAYTGELNTLDTVPIVVPPPDLVFGFVTPIVIVQMPMS